MKFGQQAPCNTLLQRKIHFRKKGIRNLNSNQKDKLIESAIVCILNFIFKFHFCT
jgi:hypothetical protein